MMVHVAVDVFSRRVLRHSLAATNMVAAQCSLPAPPFLPLARGEPRVGPSPGGCVHRAAARAAPAVGAGRRGPAHARLARAADPTGRRERAAPHGLGRVRRSPGGGGAGLAPRAGSCRSAAGRGFRIRAEARARLAGPRRPPQAAWPSVRLRLPFTRSCSAARSIRRTGSGPPARSSAWAAAAPIAMQGPVTRTEAQAAGAPSVASADGDEVLRPGPKHRRARSGRARGSGGERAARPSAPRAGSRAW